MAALSVEQMCGVSAVLAAGICTSFDSKKKDPLTGKLYHSCFMGKEAINWSASNSDRTQNCCMHRGSARELTI